ncbi:hypothetical protein [Gemmatimonas phototrophica]|uniref:Uncharacterized protein n=1 Tax=Gemmatimonas phototrophica TaxID=1379270 RepID=A0A143BMA7_9BACT|nr:hypothetical protein [Gemmatimonas phototrophica]AMW06229.1 hypothetical protein GEMMAAP_18445 [Gemmatimonas phototrophica]
MLLKARMALRPSCGPSVFGLVMLGMPIDIAVPTTGATFDERGDVLRVSGVAGGPLEVRVDAGLVFARYFGQEPRVWSDVSLATVLGWFEASSPVATFLRRKGVHPLRQLLFDQVAGHS